jgi:hypothetical protein
MGKHRSTAKMMLALASLAIANSAAAQDKVDVRNPLFAAEDARFRAMIDRDLPALDKAIAPDAIYIHANGILQTKAEYLKDVAEGRSRYRAIEAAERSVSRSGNQSITHALVRLHVGTDRIITARTTGVYRLVGKQWQVVVWQSTPVTASAPAPSPAIK